MRLTLALLLVTGATSVAVAQGGPGGREPHVGYVYPAGGQQGTSFYMLAGGQRLRNANQVYVSGEGVHATVIRPVPPPRALEKEQFQAIRKRLGELRADPSAAKPPSRNSPALSSKKRFSRKKAPPASATSQPATTRPDDATRLDVSALTLQELEYFVGFLRNREKRQINAQIADVVLIEVVIDRHAAQGDRELRIGSPMGLANPVRFQVGSLPEVCEQEQLGPVPPVMLTLEPPFLINGQIMPGDVDRFWFQAKSGQKLVMDVQARRLIPYLADAVPGWFQATLAVYDAEGKELAFADDYRFSPDPILLYEIPGDGEYQLEIRDSIYRGREDFVYRISVGELPFVTRVFPLGGRAGTARVARIEGWNLPGDRLRLDAKPGPDGIRETTARRAESRSNDVVYAVDSLPEKMETEPNDDLEHAQAVKLPRIINGRVDRPGDADVFKFSGRAGDEIVAEVYARRLSSPLDSRLVLLDASGNVLDSNDDSAMTATGLLTHYADSYLRAKLPETGDYYVQLTDTQQHGGEEYAYRLRISPPQPDFELRVTPSSINVPAGRSVPICVHVLRKDGFEGEVDLVLKDAPTGFALSGRRIPAGRDNIHLTLAAPREPHPAPRKLQIEGRANIGGRRVTRPVAPAEDMMQAFSYRHLVPCQELLVTVTGGLPRARGVGLATATPVRIPAGGTAEVRISLPPRAQGVDLQPELSEPPKGLTLQGVTAVSGGLMLVLKADAAALPPGFADNIIIELFTKPGPPPQGKPPAAQLQRVSIGYLPAIPIEIVQPRGASPE